MVLQAPATAHSEAARAGRGIVATVARHRRAAQNVHIAPTLGVRLVIAALAPLTMGVVPAVVVDGAMIIIQAGIQTAIVPADQLISKAGSIFL